MPVRPAPNKLNTSNPDLVTESFRTIFAGLPVDVRDDAMIDMPSGADFKQLLEIMARLIRYSRSNTKAVNFAKGRIWSEVKKNRQYGDGMKFLISLYGPDEAKRQSAIWNQCFWVWSRFPDGGPESWTFYRKRAANVLRTNGSVVGNESEENKPTRTVDCTDMSPGVESAHIDMYADGTIRTRIVTSNGKSLSAGTGSACQYTLRLFDRDSGEML